MRIQSFELLEQEGQTYKAKVEERIAPKWRFWNRLTTVNTYVGNSLGWYNPHTGAKLRNSEVEVMLANEMRRIYLTEMLATSNRNNLKPVK